MRCVCGNNGWRMADKAEEARPRRTGAGESDLDSLKADLGELRAELAAVVKAVQNLGSTAVATAKRQHGAALERLSSEAESLAADVTAAGRNQKAELEQRIRDQPLMAVGIAFAVGVLFGSLRR